uniref:SRCR domain-containing protein n=1 Tax=Neogobius melanostomus TaxID=47308 RepID=A0A8C6T8D0_9GOBI
MLRNQSSCLLWLWLLPLICKGRIQFTGFQRSSGVQEGDLRLAGSPRQSEGRVEIYHDGQWGTVCDDGWDLKEAQVVCRQLKFLSAKSFVTGEEIYGEASGPIWMDDMECTGTEQYLHTCPFKGWGVTDCSHKEDVGVVCDTAEGTFSNSSHVIDHRAVLSDEMGELFDSGAFCDLSITAQSSSTDDQAGTAQTTETTTLCGHKAILSKVDAFNITEETRNITVQVVQSCIPHFSSFIRYLYTRKIEVSFSSVQCLHWFSSKFGVVQLMNDCSPLFNQIFPDDSSFETPVSVHEYAVETKDLVLQEICVQYMAWNFQNFSQSPAWSHISADLLSSLLVRSDLVVPEEFFVLKTVENWILNNANIDLDNQNKMLSLVRFPLIPAEQLTKTYMLSNSSLYSTHKAVFDENMLKALQFNVQLFTNLKFKEKMLVDDVCYQPRIYTMWSESFGISYGQMSNDYVRTIYVPYHSSLIFQEKKFRWNAFVFLAQYQCSNQGIRCPSLPMARLTGYESSSQPGVVFRNRLLLMCDNGYIGQVQDFKSSDVYLTKNATQSMNYPCRHEQYKLIFVVRPEFI